MIGSPTAPSLETTRCLIEFSRTARIVNDLDEEMPRVTAFQKEKEFLRSQYFYPAFSAQIR